MYLARVKDMSLISGTSGYRKTSLKTTIITVMISSDQSSGLLRFFFSGLAVHCRLRSRCLLLYPPPRYVTNPYLLGKQYHGCT